MGRSTKKRPGTGQRLSLIFKTRQPISKLRTSTEKLIQAFENIHLIKVCKCVRNLVAKYYKPLSEFG